MVGDIVNDAVKRWYAAIDQRRSRRTYINKPIEEENILSLNRLMNDLNCKYPGVRVAYLQQPFEAVFQNSVGPYGKITGASSCIALIMNEDDTHGYEKIGYIGQSIVLEATSIGLSTCWVGGYFDATSTLNNIELTPTEKVVSLLPIGYARKNYSLTEKMMNQIGDSIKRKELSDLIEGLDLDKCPKWMREVLVAAQKAPSVRNRQPWRFHISDDHSIKISIKDNAESTNVPKRIDCGIAMLHIDVAARYHGLNGEWEYLDSPDVARYTIKK